MKLSHIGELSLIRYIKEKYQDKKKDILIGIGDDAAAIRIDDRNLLITTDLMTEDVHFEFSYSTPYQVGFKLVSINVSDIFAMYGDPKYILLSLSFPSDTEESMIHEFLDGVSHALKMYHLSLVGGDISSSKHGVTVSATVLGFADKPVTRGGAQVGDKIYVTGFLGDAACGLQLLKRIQKRICIERGEILNNPFQWEKMKPLLMRHLMPHVKKPLFRKRLIHSIIDISDGLFIDLKRLCTESNVGARIYENRLPISDEMMFVSSYLDIDPLILCTCGGEDYEYLIISHDVIRNAQCIGEIIKEDFIFVDREKKEKEWLECGYEHFKA